MYEPSATVMANIIAEQCISMVRRCPMSLPDWYEGRSAAAALICPCVETLSAHNEIRFLNGSYVQRHWRFL